VVGMASIDKWINEGEEVTADLHPHWLYFATSGGLFVGGIVVGIVSLFADGWVSTMLGWVSIGMIVVGLVWVISAYISWTTSHFIVTDDRVMYRSGFISKRGVDIPIERINNVMMNQGILERMVGTGDLMIESAGESGQQRFSNIRQPDEIQKLIYRMMNLSDDRGRQPIVSQTDAATQLEKLEGMLQRGSLTQEEFDAQKRKLLG
jgi:uncharacterized membrane protein YdbT with pleckstrin-like domain